MSDFPLWKKVYRTVTGSTVFVTSDSVAKTLKECKEELFKALLVYKPYNKDELRSQPTKYMSLGMQSFVKELGREIDLEVNTAYLLLCNYLMFDYFGKIKEFWKVTQIGDTVVLKENIFNFYVAERMFLLKVWRHMLESIYDNTKFSDQFRVFMDISISLEEFQDNLITQLQQLVLEEIPEHFSSRSHLHDKWFCRNKREQIEILSILGLTVQRKSITNERVYTLLNIFIQNNFGAQPPLPDTSKYIAVSDQQTLLYAHIMCFFIIWEKQWDKKDPKFWQKNDCTLIDRSFVHLSNQPGQCLFSATWLLLKFKMWSFDEDGVALMNTFQKDPLLTLHLVLQHPICQNSALGEVMHAATYKIIDELCSLNNNKKDLFIQPGLIPVFAEILKKTSLYRLCLREQEGLNEMFQISIASFPVFFNQFSDIIASLLQHGQYFEKALDLITHFPSYLSEMEWSTAQENIHVLQQPYQVNPESSLIIFPSGTPVGSYSINGLTLVQYKTRYNYFIYVEYLVETLMKAIFNNEVLSTNLISKIEHAYKVLIALIKNDRENISGIATSNILHRLNGLLLSLKGHYLNYTLLKLYFNLQKLLIVDKKSPVFLFTPNYIWTAFFPVVVLEDDGIRFSFKDTTFTELFRDESLRKDHAVISLCVEILAHLVVTNSPNTFVHLSGVIYILDSIFSIHLRWYFEDENERASITLNCLRILEFVLAKGRHESDVNLQKMYDFCKQALLFDEEIIDTYLGLFIKQKNYLIFLMEQETNWTEGPSLIRFNCIRQQLSLLLVLMEISENVEGCVFRSKVNSVVKPVTSYFTNFYDPTFAELSCKFLELKAKDSNISLLPLLELDHYQVQALFLEKLRDSLEDEKIKIAIINLINTCVANQDGMTAAFFNLKCFHYWDGSEIDIYSGDSICDFMIDYLQNLKKSDEYLKNPLQLGILHLFKNLWVNHREKLVENIARLSDFWPVMLHPFLCEFVQDVDVYQTILTIINMEVSLTKGKDLHPEFVATMKLFLHDDKQLKDWINFVTQSSFELKENLLLLNTWTEFLVVSNKVWREIFTSKMKDTIIDSLLNGLLAPYSETHHLESLYFWLEIYLILISSWNQPHLHSQIVKKLTKFLRSLRTYYKRIEPRIREVVLSIIFKTIEDMAVFFNNHSTELLEFLHPINYLLEDEFAYLSEEVWRSDESKIVQNLRPWLLVILIGKALLKLENTTELELFLHFLEYIPKILTTFIRLIQIPKTFSFAKLAIEYLIQHALSPLAEDFLYVDLISFYGQIRPPVLKISLGDALSDGLSANLKDWWLIFILLVKLHTILLNKIGVRFLPTAFSFIKQHDKVFYEMISLAKHTVDLTALTLVHETLQYFYAVLIKKPFWFAEEPESYQLLQAATKTTLNVSVLSVVGYKKLNFYEILYEKKIQSIDEPEIDLTVTVLNKLCEIIYWSCITLTQMLPNVVNELCTVDPDEHINLLVGNDFSVPRFELPIPTELTYGMLLCLADFLCKALNQLSPDTPQSTPRSQKLDMATLKENRLEIVYQHCTVIYHKFIGFMVYVQRSDELPSDNISSLLHYDPTVSSSSTLLSLLDYQFVRYALEALMRFLLTEIFFAVRMLEEEALVAFRRELTSEIQFFYEFVRKRTTELYNKTLEVVASTPQPLDADVINKYFSIQVGSNNAQAISDDNFVIVLALWFVKVLGLNN